MQLTCRIDQMLDHTGDYCTKLIAARVTLCLYFVTEIVFQYRYVANSMIVINMQTEIIADVMLILVMCLRMVLENNWSFRLRTQEFLMMDGMLE